MAVGWWKIRERMSNRLYVSRVGLGSESGTSEEDWGIVAVK